MTSQPKLPHPVTITQTASAENGYWYVAKGDPSDPMDVYWLRANQVIGGMQGVGSKGTVQYHATRTGGGFTFTPAP